MLCLNRHRAGRYYVRYRRKGGSKDVERPSREDGRRRGLNRGRIRVGSPEI